MKRKLFGAVSMAILLLVPLLFLAWGFGGVAAQKDRFEFMPLPLNPDYQAWLQEFAREGFQMPVTEEYGYSLGHIPPLVDPKFLDRIPLAAPLALEPMWDWRTQNGTTPVRDQGDCGSCWAFGNLGSLESYYKINTSGHPNVNLSENNMASCHWNWAWARCYGGNSWVAVTYLTGLTRRNASDPLTKIGPRGILLESQDPYNPASHDVVLCTNAGRPNPWRRVTGARWVANSRNAIKNVVRNKGPMVTSMRWEDAKFGLATHVYYYPNCTAATNHQVLIVGWDDNQAHPGGTGCWIVKNSWGDFPGSLNGYFYCAYESGKMGVASDNVYYTGLRAYDHLEIIYMEDQSGIQYIVSGGIDNVGYGAIVFTQHTHYNGTLTHVEFFAPENKMPYTIKVWGTVTGGAGTSNVSFFGLLATKTGVCQEMGYYSIPLTTPVPLTKGHRYGVEVKFTARTPYPDGKYYPIPTDGPSRDCDGQWVTYGNTKPETSWGTAKGYIRSTDTGPFGRAMGLVGDDPKVYVFPPCVRALTKVTVD